MKVLFSRSDFEAEPSGKVTVDFWFVEVAGRRRIAEMRVQNAGGADRYVFVADRPHPVGAE